MFTQKDLLEALEACYVPSLRRDVVAAGLVQSVTLAVDREAPGAGIAGVPARSVAHVVLRAPGAEELVNAQVRAAVENRLMGMPQISRAEVTMLPALFAILRDR